MNLNEGWILKWNGWMEWNGMEGTSRTWKDGNGRMGGHSNLRKPIIPEIANGENMNVQSGGCAVLRSRMSRPPGSPSAPHHGLLSSCSPVWRQ